MFASILEIFAITWKKAEIDKFQVNIQLLDVSALLGDFYLVHGNRSKLTLICSISYPNMTAPVLEIFTYSDAEKGWNSLLHKTLNKIKNGLLQIKSG